MSRDELRARIWPQDVHLDFERALDTAAHKVRKALGDSAKAPRFIETLPGRGYRFLGEASLVSTEGRAPKEAGSAEAEPVLWLRDGSVYVPGDAPNPRKRMGGILLGALLATLAGGFLLWRAWPRRPGPAAEVRTPVVLALPSTVVGPPEVAYLSDAVPSSLSTLLAGVEGLETRLPPSSLEMEKVKGDVGRVAELYQAHGLVITSVTVQGARMILDVRLAEAATRRIRWARQFEGTRETYHELIRTASASLLEVLKPGGQLPPRVGSGGSELELALAEGWHFCRRHWHLGQSKDFDLALAAFRRAETLDPPGSDSAAGRAVLFNDLYWNTRDPKALKEARAWAGRALERDPRCGQAWMVQGFMVTNLPVNDPGRSIDHVLKAAYFAPRDPRVHQGLGAVAGITNGIFIAAARKSMELDPMDTGGYAWAALGLILDRRGEEALLVLDRALRLEPEHTFNQYLKFLALFRLGRMEEAQRAFAPGFGAKVMLSLAKGDRATARDLMAQQAVTWRRDRKAFSMDWANLAIFHSPLLVRLELRDEALWLLQRSVEARNPPPYDWLIQDPDLQRLKGDPRFEEVLEGARKVAGKCLERFEQAHSRGELPRYLEPPMVRLRELVNR